MTPTQRAAMEQALETLEKHCTAFLHHEEPYVDAIAALRAALAETAEPVGINGLTETETSASASVMGFAAPQPPAPAKPVGQMVGHHKVGFGEMPTIQWRDGYWPQVGTKLYIAQPPAPAQAVELTDEEIDRVTYRQWGEMKGHPLATHRAFARAAIAAHEAKKGTAA